MAELEKARQRSVARIIVEQTEEIRARSLYANPRIRDRSLPAEGMRARDHCSGGAAGIPDCFIHPMIKYANGVSAAATMVLNNHP